MHACTLEPVVINVVSTVIGGLVLALFFFLMKEKFCPLPNVVGRWYFEMQTESTSYRLYEGMTLSYVAVLWREGHVFMALLRRSTRARPQTNEIMLGRTGLEEKSADT